MSRSRKSAGGTVLTVISLLLAFFMLFPIIWSFFCSIQSESKQFAVIWDWLKPPYTLTNYRYILSGTSVFRWFINSLVTSVLSTVITVLISTMAAYAIAKIRFRAAKALYYYIMVGLLVPTEATIVPLFIEVNKMNLINTYAGLILPGVAGAMNLVICVSFFRGLPNELIEAVRIDGGGEFTIFRAVVLPLSRPIIATISILSFIGSWNNYLWPLLCVFTDDMYTLPVGLPTFMSIARPNYSVPMTANMVASIPAIILYLVFERQITEGITVGSIKG